MSKWCVKKKCIREGSIILQSNLILLATLSESVYSSWKKVHHRGQFSTMKIFLNLVKSLLCYQYFFFLSTTSASYQHAGNVLEAFRAGPNNNVLSAHAGGSNVVLGLGEFFSSSTFFFSFSIWITWQEFSSGGHKEVTHIESRALRILLIFQ